jgi:translation initiation factor IF-1
MEAVQDNHLRVDLRAHFERHAYVRCRGREPAKVELGIGDVVEREVQGHLHTSAKPF